MQLLYLICLLLPLALALGPAWRVAGPVVPRAAASAGAPWYARLVLAGLAVAVLTYCASLAWLDRYLTFDDAFMSYRYARHLGEGLGLVWNAGEAPVEGFTNLLLVILLAPFTRLGLDPLQVTRVLSLMAAVGLAWIVYLRARAGQARTVAIAVCLTWVIGNVAFSLVMVGLETVLFAVLLFAGFHLASGYLLRDDRRALRGAGVVLVLALWTRPEAAIFAVILTIGVLGLGWRDGRGRGPLLDLVFTFWVPVLLYLVFKLVYFGGLLPNPAYIKLGQGGLLSEAGTVSVREFLTVHWKWIVAAAAGALLPCSTREARVRVLAATYLLAHTAFYLRVDTLMDIYGRFLFPAAPFLFELVRPLAERAHAAWLTQGRGPAWAITAGAIFFFVAVPNHDGTLTVIQRAAAGEYNFAPGPSHMPSRGHSWHMREKSRALGEYPGIRDLTMASVDAGVLAYDSGIRHIDTVGLNDRFIAREKGLDVLTAYLFGRKPELILQRARLDGTLIGYGHGVLGNTAAWATHPGWDEYIYAGSITDVEPWRHEMHVYLRRDAAGAVQLLEFLRERVVDRVHESAPISLGTRPQATGL